MSTDVRHFVAKAGNGQDFELFDRNCYEYDTALEAWMQQMVVQNAECIEALIDARFAGMSFVRYKQNLSWSSWL